MVSVFFNGRWRCFLDTLIILYFILIIIMVPCVLDIMKILNNMTTNYMSWCERKKEEFRSCILPVVGVNV